MAVKKVPQPFGGLVLLERHVAASSAALDFTNFVDSLYDDYLIVISKLQPATDAVHIYVEMGTGAGPTWDTGNNYEWAAIARNAVGGSHDYSGSGSGICRLYDNVSNNGALGGCNGTYALDGASQSTHRLGIYGTGQYIAGGPGQRAFQTFGMQWTVTGTPLTGLRFIASSGNLSSGSIAIYGYAKIGGV